MPLRHRHGQPLPYAMVQHRSDDGKTLRHAVITCCDCSATEQFPWVKQANPTFISVKFERLGWVLYQNKARCQDCGTKRKQQQAAFARLNNEEPDPRQTNHPGRPILHPVTAVPAPTETAPRIFILVIDEHGNATITPSEDAKEMLFGDETYLVIPHHR
jgi:hypothetical protein